MTSKNHNIFQPANFHVVFLPPYEELNDYVVTVTTPDFTLGGTSAFPANSSRVPYPGNEILPSDLLVHFMLDENFRAYRIIWDWLNDIKDNTDPKADPINTLYDIKLVAYDSQQTNTVAEWTLGNSFPAGLPSVSLSHNDNATEAQSFPVFFKHQFLEFSTIDPTSIEIFKDV